MGSDDRLDHIATFARDLDAASGPVQAAQYVVDAAVELVSGCQAASISLASREGQVRTSAATSDAMRRADELQTELAEGPCVDAVWQTEIVSVEDLRTEDRWPRWARRTLEELQFLSMLSLRLFTDSDRLGALNMFSDQAHAFSDEDVAEGLVIAAHAAIAVASAEKVSGLESALVNRTTIAEATGLLMAHFALTNERAFDVLRRLSSHQNTRLSVVARRIVDQHNADPHTAPQLATRPPD